MTKQDTHYNQDPLVGSELSVPSVALLRRALIRRSAEKINAACDKRGVPHSPSVQSRAANWARTYNPLEWMSVTSTQTGDSQVSVNEITDGNLNLQQAINQVSQVEFIEPEPTKIVNPLDPIEDRIAEARDRVSKVFDESPYQYLPSDLVAISEESKHLTDENFVRA